MVAVHPLPVAAIDPLTDDSVALTFAVPADVAEDYRFLAGQHLTIVGPDEGRRSFSICTTPTSRRLQVGIKRLPGGVFSDGVLSTLRVGDPLDVMTPAGRFTFAPRPDAGPTRYVAIAAGSGITPILSIITTMLECEPDCEVTLVYANQTSRTVMFLDEVHGLKDRFVTRFRLIHVLSREAQEVELLSGRLDTERLDRLLDSLIPPDDVDAWYLCGPLQMVVDLRAHLTGRGVSEGAVHAELFHADPVPRSHLAPVAGVPDGAAEVTIRLDGRSSEFSLKPDDVGVLEAALRVRSDLPFACRGGVCGTCRAKVIEGSVSMDINYALEPEEIEAGYVLTCQSHPTSAKVVLDYDA